MGMWRCLLARCPVALPVRANTVLEQASLAAALASIGLPSVGSCSFVLPSPMMLAPLLCCLSRFSRVACYRCQVSASPLPCCCCRY